MEDVLKEDFDLTFGQMLKEVLIRPRKFFKNVNEHQWRKFIWVLFVSFFLAAIIDDAAEEWYSIFGSIILASLGVLISFISLNVVLKIFIDISMNEVFKLFCYSSIPIIIALLLKGAIQILMRQLNLESFQLSLNGMNLSPIIFASQIYSFFLFYFGLEKYFKPNHSRMIAALFLYFVLAAAINYLIIHFVLRTTT